MFFFPCIIVSVCRWRFLANLCKIVKEINVFKLFNFVIELESYLNVSFLDLRVLTIFNAVAYLTSKSIFHMALN